jgi:hypothetical protein
VDLGNVAQRYLEPIAALQDEDLAFPDAVRFAYYALYNCFEKYVGRARHRRLGDRESGPFVAGGQPPVGAFAGGSRRGGQHNCAE